MKSGFKRLRIGTCRWIVRPGWERLLPDLTELDRGLLPSLPSFRRIKTSHSRAVFSFQPEIDLPPVVLKRYLYPSVSDRLKILLTGGRASREFRIYGEVRRRGIPTAEPLALGIERRFGIPRRSWLLLRKIPSDGDLHEWLTGGRLGLRERRALLREAARLVRRTHDEGIYQRDFHVGNLLLQRRPEGSVRIFLLDLHRASALRTISARRRIRGVVQLSMYASLFLKPRDRLAFLRDYVGDWSPFPLSFGKLARRVEKGSNRARWRLWQRRRKRCLRENKYFFRVRVRNLRGVCRRDLEGAGLRGVLGSPDALLHRAEKKMKDSRSSTVGRISLPSRGKTLCLVIKRSNVKKLWTPLRHLFLSSRARASWVNAHSLLMRHVKTPRPLLFFEERRWGLTFRSYYITEALRHPRLSECLGKAPAERGRLLDELAHFLGRLHALGIRHGDLKASNILVREGTPLDFYLTDLEGMTLRRRPGIRLRAKNFYQLFKSFPSSHPPEPHERKRFLERYGSVEGLAPGFLKKVSSRTKGFLRRRRKRKGR